MRIVYIVITRPGQRKCDAEVYTATLRDSGVQRGAQQPGRVGEGREPCWTLQSGSSAPRKFE